MRLHRHPREANMAAAAFALNSVALPRQAPARRPRAAAARVTSAHAVQPPPPTSRRAVLRSGAAALLALALPARPPAATAAAVATDPAADAVRAVAMCVRVLGPVERYVRVGAWDRARTNVNYCSRVLQLRTRMRAGAETLASDDAYLTAMEAAAEVSNLLTSADSSIYTAGFIPQADDEVDPEQRQYQTAAYRFLGEASEYLQAFLGVFDEDVVAAAAADAKTARYEIRVEEP